MAIYTVTTLSDSGNDGTISGTLAEEQTDGDGLSLREAMELAAASGDFNNVISFATGLSGTLRLEQGALTVRETMRINGNGQITITGDANDDDVLEAGADITDVAASRNAGLLSDNSRLFEASFFGFDILTVTDLTLTGGYSTGDGGAVAVYSSVTFEDVIAAGNGTAGNGGAVSTSSFNATRSVLRDNHVFDGGSGGALAVGNFDVSLTNSTVADNTIHGSGSGGGVSSHGSIVLTASTISENAILGGGDGGGVSASDEVRLINATVANNRITGTNSEGAGISADTAVRLYSSTVSGNTASGEGSRGGGIYTNAFLPRVGQRGVDLTNSIVSGNAAAGASDLENEIAIDRTTPLSLLRMAGGNLVADTVSLDGVVTGTANAAEVFSDTVVVNDVASGVLRDNGGCVETLALLQGGAAINAGDLSEASGLSTDARGQTRVSDGQIDLGAFELRSSGDPAQSLPPGGALNEINASDQDDVIVGAIIADLILAGGGRDRVQGGDGNDEIRGGDGDDSLSGDAGIDTVLGGNGNDRILVSEADDVVVEIAGEGYDRVIASISYELSDHIEAGNLLGFAELSMTAASTGSWLNGNAGNNALRGLDGRDRIDGNAGDDTIDGAGGNDLLEGGAGSDVFLFETGHAVDLILDFELGVDVIDYSGTSLSFEDLRIVDIAAGGLVISEAGLILVRSVDAALINADQFDFG